MAEFLGALAITFLLSRLVLWLLKKWHGGSVRIVLAHFITVVFCVVLSAFGHADGGPLNWSFSAVYFFAVVAWLIIDLINSRPAKAKISL